MKTLVSKQSGVNKNSLFAALPRNCPAILNLSDLLIGMLMICRVYGIGICTRRLMAELGLSKAQISRWRNQLGGEGWVFMFAQGVGKGSKAFVGASPCSKAEARMLMRATPGIQPTERIDDLIYDFLEVVKKVFSYGSITQSLTILGRLYRIDSSGIKNINFSELQELLKCSITSARNTLNVLVDAGIMGKKSHGVYTTREHFNPYKPVKLVRSKAALVAPGSTGKQLLPSRSLDTSIREVSFILEKENDLSLGEKGSRTPNKKSSIHPEDVLAGIELPQRLNKYDDSNWPVIEAYLLDIVNSQVARDMDELLKVIKPSCETERVIFLSRFYKKIRRGTYNPREIHVVASRVASVGRTFELMSLLKTEQWRNLLDAVSGDEARDQFWDQLSYTNVLSCDDKMDSVDTATFYLRSPSSNYVLREYTLDQMTSSACLTASAILLFAAGNTKDLDILRNAKRDSIVAELTGLGEVWALVEECGRDFIPAYLGISWFELERLRHAKVEWASNFKINYELLERHGYVEKACATYASNN